MLLLQHCCGIVDFPLHLCLCKYKYLASQMLRGMPGSRTCTRDLASVCQKRLLRGQINMSLTTLQFYAMVNFCNPGVLGTPAEFRKKYERPILEGREPGVGPEKV
jgi:hypothetical protein